MIDALTYAIVLLVLIQSSWHRVQVVFIFAMMTFIHNLFMAHLDGLPYYLSDAMFYAFVISATAMLPKISELTMSIHRICLAAIVLDVFGWVIWMLYLPPDSYNVAFMLLYAWTIIIIISGDREDAGSPAMDRWPSIFRASAYPRHNINHSHQETKWHSK